MILDRPVGAHGQELLRIGETFKTDIQPFAHHAVGTICTDQVIGPEARQGERRFRGHADTAGVLLEVHQPVRKQHLGIGHRRQPLGEPPRQFVLLALDPERIAGLGGDLAKIEGVNLVVAAVAVLKDRCAQALFQQRAGDIDFLQHLERRRMKS